MSFKNIAIPSNRKANLGISIHCHAGYKPLSKIRYKVCFGAKNRNLLVLAGVEFIFFIVAATELHFVFVLEAVLIIQQCMYVR